MPGIIITEQSIAVSAPNISTADVGIVGPATKGEVNVLSPILTNESDYTSRFGEPTEDNMYAQRAAVRYYQKGSRLRQVRVAGSLLAKAKYVIKGEEDNVEFDAFVFEAKTPGSWANRDLTLQITHASEDTFNVIIFEKKVAVERYLGLDLSNAENAINNQSSYITLSIDLRTIASETLPDATVDSSRELVYSVPFVGGNDGAFASSRSPDSSTSGIAAQNNFAYTIPDNGTVDFSNTENRAIAPGTFVVTCATPSETFSDDGKGILTGDQGGTGRIVNYKTGEWFLAFDDAPTVDISVSYFAGTYELVGSTATGDNSYSGNIIRKGVKPSFVTFHQTRFDQLDLGDGSTSAYSLTLTTGIVPKSVIIKAEDINGNVLTVTDDGEGALIGDVSSPGTINYSSGSISFEFEEDIANTEVITGQFKIYIRDNGAGVLSGGDTSGTINYITGAWTLSNTLTPSGDRVPNMLDGGDIEAIFRHADIPGVGDGSETEFSGKLKEYPVKPGSVVVNHSVSGTLTDAGNGTLTGAGGSGTIDYQTGEYTLTFSSAPASGFEVQVYSDVIILHCTAKYMGDMGNERDTLTDGLFGWVDKAASSPSNTATQYYRFRTMFNNVAKETFDNIRTVDALVEKVNNATNGSKYIKLESTGYQGEIDVASTGQKIGMTGAFTNADVVGVNTSTLKTGMQLFRDQDSVAMNFLATPGCWHRSVINAGIELVSARNAQYIVSMPKLLTSQDNMDFVNGSYNAATEGGIAVPTIDVPFPPLSPINDSYSAGFGAWVTYFDQYANKDVSEPMDGDILKGVSNIARTTNLYPSIAGPNWGKLTNISDISFSPNDEEQNIMTSQNASILESINPVVRITGLGIFINDQVTFLRENSPMREFNNRWLANVIKANLRIEARRFQHAGITSSLFNKISNAAHSIIRPYSSDPNGRIFDYRVFCNEQTTPLSVQEQNKVICKIFIKFNALAKFILFQMTYTPLSVDFTEVANQQLAVA